MFIQKEEEEIARLLFIILNMLNHQIGIEGIKINITNIYKITQWIYDDNYVHNRSFLVTLHLPKIWSAVLNRPKNTFKIDKISKLKVFAALFAIDICCKLKKVLRGSGNFELTKNKKKKLYIIYFALVAFPLIEELEDALFYEILTELHMSFQRYFEVYSIEDIPIESQFIILQYYIKSSATLKIDRSSHDSDVIFGLLRWISEFPSLKRHSFNESYTSIHSTMIQGFIEELIFALSDELYIQKLKTEKKLLMYENVKKNYLTMFPDDFIDEVFSRCRWDILDKPSYRISENSMNDQYKTHNRVFRSIIASFNDFKYLNTNQADSYLRLFNLNTIESTPFANSKNTTCIYEKYLSNTTIQSSRPTFAGL
ncbi:hypothetical protein RF11_11154 [Thelohanellus kitauei]|uniref:Uncharacterized protein n=1 Tax=Thelohanellus kitauei TaxID=669202 RepID=A0A0C2N8Y7_THEKT|nr:hypothetical protein RF11_11154 [Thelohanellus kitauei]